MRLKGKKIYIADDDLNVLEIVTKILEKEGATVIQGTDGKKIFTSVSVSFNKPDCIILDLFMPNANGFEAIDAMKDFLLLDCPIIVLTGYATDENISRVSELGVSTFLTKPVNSNELISTVVKLVEEYSGKGV